MMILGCAVLRGRSVGASAFWIRAQADVQLFKLTQLRHDLHLRTGGSLLGSEGIHVEQSNSEETGT